MKKLNHRQKIENTLSNLADLIEELRLIESELIESEERYRLVAEYAYDWEYWQDKDGSLIYCSPSCETITGYSSEEFVQDKELLTKIIHPDDMEKWLHHAHEMSDKGEVEPVEFRIYTKDGETRWIHHVCRRVYGRDGEDRGVRGSNRDVSARMKLKEEVKILKGFLPICASCKNIRDDKGYWKQIESYITEHSEAEFSHGICPKCVEKLYPEFISKNQDK